MRGDGGAVVVWNDYASRNKWLLLVEVEFCFEGAAALQDDVKRPLESGGSVPILGGNGGALGE